MSSQRFTRHKFILPLYLALSLPILLASKTFEKPVAKPATNYPAHDFHPDEQVAIAADPYDTPEKAKVFSVDFAKAGFLPIFFIITNDGNQPVSIAHMQVTLITGNHSKLTPASPDDIYRRLANPQANTEPPSRLPIPGKKVKGTLTSKEMNEIESSQFAARAVEPHGTQSGFLFFDIGGISSPLAGSNLDITGVDDAKGNETMYFEVSMEQYLHPASNP
jgi:hypothetical protein